MDTLVIRQANNTDLLAAHEVERKAYNEAEAASLERFEERLEKFSDGFLLAELGGKIVGIVNSATLDKEDISDEELKEMIGHVPGGKNIVIFTFAILPEFQGKGISKPLMDEFIKRSKESGKEKILLICKDTLVDYYKKYGFINLGKSKSTFAGVEWIEMSLSLK
ncbi:GNAT family N-acetyltransferase [Candidatus Undinarchaeota archaeon]